MWEALFELNASAVVYSLTTKRIFHPILNPLHSPSLLPPPFPHPFLPPLLPTLFSAPSPFPFFPLPSPYLLLSPSSRPSPPSQCFFLPQSCSPPSDSISCSCRLCNSRWTAAPSITLSRTSTNYPSSRTTSARGYYQL